MASSKHPRDERYVELHIKDLPSGVTALDIQQALAANTVKVVQCRVKNQHSRKPFAFVLVEGVEDKDMATGSEIFVGLNQLTVSVSNRSRNHAAALSREEDLRVLPNLRSFSIGVALDQRGAFLERWSSAGMHDQGPPKFTLNLLQEQMHICFATAAHSYKVLYSLDDLSYVADIPARCFPGQSTDSALVFVFNCAPRIFRQDRVAGIEEGECLWVRGDIENERDWRRTTANFTGQEGILGQYFHYMIRIPGELREKKRRLVRAIEDNRGDECVDVFDVLPCSVEPLLPALTPARRCTLCKGLSFHILFLMERLVADGLLYHELLNERFFSLLNRNKKNVAYRALQHFEQKRQTLENPAADLEKALRLVERNEDDARHIWDDRRLEDDSHINVHRLTITPLSTFCSGPDLDTPNRVLRHYRSGALGNHFLRVSFTDENGEKLNVGKTDRPLTELLDTVKERLARGFYLGHRHYEFLAMSSSQLREGSCWFFAAGHDGEEFVTPDKVRCWMGDFNGIRNVAKYAARMGQCFSSTVTSGKMQIKRDEFDEIPDIKTECGKYTFSDGIGMISKELAQEAARSLQKEYAHLPSAYQIRFAGYKGMVAVDLNMPAHLKLRLRPSMRKFDSEHLHLEVIQATRFLPGHLNRQIILLLSALGVRDGAFITLLNKMIVRFEEMLVKNEAAKLILAEGALHDPFAPATMLYKMLEGGFDVLHEPFLQEMLLKLRNHQLFKLEEKTRIYAEKSAFLKGVLDESGLLGYGQVFCRIQRKDSCRAEVIRGRVAIAKNPCLHPGDIRVLEAVDRNDLDVPEGIPLWLDEMVNCVVFPQRGKRPHPDECSGSDLDGDDYFITWDSSLVPNPAAMWEPMNYEPQKAKIVDEGAKIGMRDIVNFFIDYMQNDILGQISNNHVAIADESEEGACDKRCRELAELHSTAVDYPKTGHPAKMKPEHYPATYPDFMKKKDKLTRESKKVTGVLFRRIKQHRPRGMPPLMSRLDDHFDRDLLVAGRWHDKLVRSARSTKEAYDRKLRSIMNRYSIHSEAEAIGGYMVRLGHKHKRKRLHDVQAQVRLETAKLRRKFLEEEFMSTPSSLEDREKERYFQEKASAWYVVTYSKDHRQRENAESSGRRGRRSQPMVSFAWVPYAFLCTIKQQSVRVWSRK